MDPMLIVKDSASKAAPAPKAEDGAGKAAAAPKADKKKHNADAMMAL